MISLTVPAFENVWAVDAPTQTHEVGALQHWIVSSSGVLSFEQPIFSGSVSDWVLDCGDENTEAKTLLDGGH